MRTMSKLFATTLLASATIWACGVDRAPSTAHTDEQALSFEDGPGSGSGTDPTPTPDPTPDPEPTCSSTAGGPTQAQLDEAKKKLKKYLNGCTGQKAIDKVLGDFDKNKDGQLDGKEMYKLIEKIELGWPFYQKWCDGVMGAIDKDENGKATVEELKKFLEQIGLGGADQCVAPTEDNPTSEIEL